MYYIILLLVLGALYKLIIPTIRGKQGERIVKTKLHRLPKEEYFVINDLLVNTGRSTAQIDHAVVSPYGIFVIETKNYKGWILGSENSEDWTKNVYGKKYRFRNPLKQNYGHVKVLESALHLPSWYFVPIVVFTRRATVKVKTSQNLIYVGQLLGLIKSYQQQIITPAEAEMIARRLNALNVTESGARKEHVSAVKSEIRDVKEKVSSGICPKCGGTLTLRKGKYGSFYGCSNYPKCRYTKNVN